MFQAKDMKWKAVVLGALILGLLCWREMDRKEIRETRKATTTNSSGLIPRPIEKPPGEQILKTYASASTRPEDDLQAMAHVLSNLRLLVKGDAPFRMGANEEFAAALLGKNAAKEVFLTSPHACLNDQSQLIDRWGTALFFHVRNATRIDLRSAGPDREMWTEDDLHRQHEGEFIRGASLPEANAR
jgi:hypothetical protein